MKPGIARGSVLVALLVCSGCGDDLPMSQIELQEFAVAEFGGDPDLGEVESVLCDSGLDADDTATTQCSLTLANGGKGAVTARVVRDGSHLSPVLEFTVAIPTR